MKDKDEFTDVLEKTEIERDQLKKKVQSLELQVNSLVTALEIIASRGIGLEDMFDNAREAIEKYKLKQDT